MACRNCGGQEQGFPAEVVAGFPGIERLEVPRVHISTKILVCMDCGYTELTVPRNRLEQLKNGMTDAPPKRMSGTE
jgi:hypothetical protein